MLKWLKDILNFKRKYTFIFKIENYPGAPEFIAVDDIVGPDFASELGVFIVQEPKDDRGHLLIVDTDNQITIDQLQAIFRKYKITASLVE